MSEKTKQPKKVVLLDLDGTLTKSDPGIIGCVVKAFEEMGYPVPDDAELHRFIGPAIERELRKLERPSDHAPVTATLACVASAAMAGVPLLNGFLSKEMFFAETVFTFLSKSATCPSASATF